MIDALYRVPLTFSDLDGEGVTLPSLKTVGWVRTPSLRMPGTREAGPGGQFFLVHALVQDGLTAQEINDLIAGDCLGALGWPAVGDPPARPEIIPLDQVALLDFMQDVDDQGTRPTDLSVMHIYAGRPWLL